MRKIAQLIVTVIVDNISEETAEAYGELIAGEHVPVRLGIGTSSWPVHGSSSIMNIIEVEETSK